MLEEHKTCINNSAIHSIYTANITNVERQWIFMFLAWAFCAFNECGWNTAKNYSHLLQRYLLKIHYLSWHRKLCEKLKSLHGDTKEAKIPNQNLFSPTKLTIDSAKCLSGILWSLAGTFFSPIHTIHLLYLGSGSCDQERNLICQSLTRKDKKEATNPICSGFSCLNLTWTSTARALSSQNSSHDHRKRLTILVIESNWNCDLEIKFWHWGILLSEIIIRNYKVIRN